MNKQLNTIFVAAVLLLLSPVLSFATGKSKMMENMTLQEVLEEVTRTDPSILEALRHYESVVAELGIAESEFLPTIGTQMVIGPEWTDGVDTGNESEELVSKTATLYARQNLYNGGKSTAFVKETEARIKAAAYDVLKVANDVYLEAAEAYINVVKTRDLLEIAEGNAVTQEKIMRQVREKTDAGFNRVSELYNSESRLALSKGSYISRQQDLNQALVMFHRRFGRLFSADQFVKPAVDYAPPATLEETVDLAFNVHPALKVAEYNIETSRYAFDKSKAADLPTLDLEVRGQYRDDTGGDEGDTSQLGAYLTFNYTFWDGGLRESQQQYERQRVRKENQRSYIERRNLNEAVRLAWNIMEAENYKKEYLGEHVRLSAKTLDAFKEEYYVGRRTLLDLLNMENEYTDAQLSYSESQFSHLISLYRLMQATGVLLDAYDTGLREKLNLSAEDYGSIFKDQEQSTVEAYEGLENNRDKDQHIDSVDQCDNSRAGENVESFGCLDASEKSAGYPHRDDAELGAYIVPQSFDVPAVAEGAQSAETFILPEPGVRVPFGIQANSKVLTGAGMKKLVEFTRQLLIKRPDAKLLIEGYVASDVDSEEIRQLSYVRAETVRDYLTDAGIAKENITVLGLGAQNQTGDNSTPAGRAENRRIEISIVE